MPSSISSCQTTLKRPSFNKNSALKMPTPQPCGSKAKRIFTATSPVECRLSLVCISSVRCFCNWQTKFENSPSTIFSLLYVENDRSSSWCVFEARYSNRYGKSLLKQETFTKTLFFWFASETRCCYLLLHCFHSTRFSASVGYANNVKLQWADLKTEKVMEHVILCGKSSQCNRL